MGVASPPRDPNVNRSTGTKSTRTPTRSRLKPSRPRTKSRAAVRPSSIQPPGRTAGQAAVWPPAMATVFSGTRLPCVSRRGTSRRSSSSPVFFFQAEDGIRDGRVTGVQTCALPIFGYALAHPRLVEVLNRVRLSFNPNSIGQVGATAALDDRAHLDKTLQLNRTELQIGRASGRERV